VTLVLLNKPHGVLCQFTDGDGRATLADFVDVPGVYPAGRLDRDSEGLVLLTDDGALQHRVSHPRHKLLKRYAVQVDGAIDDASLRRLVDGVTLADGAARAIRAKALGPPDASPGWLWPRDPPVRHRARIPTSWIELAIDEGRNRQVRRMTAAIGHPTLRLVRIAIGPFTLDGLAPGECREASAHGLPDPPPDWSASPGSERTAAGAARGDARTRRRRRESRAGRETRGRFPGRR